MARLLLVLALALAVLGVGIGSAVIASLYSDPVSRIRAQDESIYVNSVQGIVKGGYWVTPRVLGRFWLLKPPLLVWCVGVSVKLFGWSLWALRLPALLAGAVGCVVLFWLAERSGTPGTGWTAALLMMSNSLWHTFSRLCYTDTLFACSTIGCVAILHADPRLKSRISAAGFAALCAVAFMVKSVGGFLPLIILAGHSWLAARDARPSMRRLLLVFGITGALVAPWHLYQLIVHPRWFWADYIQTQLLQFGLHPPVQTTPENSIEFYGRRQFTTDPVLWLAAMAALPSMWSAWRRGTRALPVLLGTWLFTTIACVLLYGARNLPYSLNMIPPACVIAAVYLPSPRHIRRFVPIVLCLVFAVKAAYPTEVWGLRFGAADPLPSENELRLYAGWHRSNMLIIADPDDEFYSCTLLPRVHYYFLDPRGLVPATIPHYSDLGITTTVDEFADRARFEAKYGPRLRAWGLDSNEALATAITAATPDGLGKLIAAAPEYDYFVTRRDFDAVRPIMQVTHDARPVANGRVFLLSHAR